MVEQSTDHLDRREMIVLTVLAGADDAELATGEIADMAGEYDDSIEYNKQISRPLDELEDKGLVETRYGESDGVLNAPRIARLTPRGERVAGEVSVAPVAAESLDELEDAMIKTREDLDDLASSAARGEDIGELHRRISDLEERLDDVEALADEAAAKAEESAEVAGKTEEKVFKELEVQDARIKNIEDRLETLGETVDRMRETMQDYVRPAVEYVFDHTSARPSAGDSE